MRKYIYIAVVLTILFSLVAFMPVTAKDTRINEEFTASASITQDPSTANPVPSEREGYMYQTIGEVLNGTVSDCTWPELNNATIYMVNDSYFNIVGYQMTGISEATITFITKHGRLLVSAKGDMVGIPLYQVTSTMTWQSIKGTGHFEGVNADGNLTATFVWTTPPSGTGTITGQYDIKERGYNRKNK